MADIEFSLPWEFRYKGMFRVRSSAPLAGTVLQQAAWRDTCYRALSNEGGAQGESRHKKRADDAALIEMAQTHRHFV
ncbi:hypothetical protein C2855_08110 [Aeromonas bestiarum]|nr:hypothetical protein C2855_08110 [Aeromonas bestiarum]